MLPSSGSAPPYLHMHRTCPVIPFGGKCFLRCVLSWGCLALPGSHSSSGCGPPTKTTRLQWESSASTGKPSGKGGWTPRIDSVHWIHESQWADEREKRISQPKTDSYRMKFIVHECKALSWDYMVYVCSFYFKSVYVERTGWGRNGLIVSVKIIYWYQ